MEYSVKLDAFEGPLDLLLHLINRFEINIYDIPVAKITEQYLSYIHAMKELKLDVASEYLVMAATLLAIKSKMLLPKQEQVLDDDVLEDDDGEDPRKELIERLIEYKKYKEAAKELQKYEQNRSQIYTKAPGDLTQFVSTTEDKPVLDVSIYDILGAFQKMLDRKKKEQPVQRKIHREEISIEGRMTEILADLENRHEPVSFYSLFPVINRGHMVVSFLAILELMKTNKIRCEQTNNFEDILIHLMEGAVNFG